MPARVPMTERRRDALLALPETESEVVRHHSLDAADVSAVGEARTPETRLSYALQLCCLRYPGRNLRRGETLPAIMLEHWDGGGRERLDPGAPRASTVPPVTVASEPAAAAEADEPETGTNPTRM